MRVRTTGLACPERGQLVTALARQGLAADDGSALTLDLRADGSAVVVELRAATGSTLLRRVLAAGDCEALAETVALLLERRVREVQWEARIPAMRAAQPAAPPAATRAPVVEMTAGVQLASGLGALRPGPSVGLRSWLATAITAGLAAGWSRREEEAGPGSLTLDRIPLDLDAGWGIRGRRWRAAALGRVTLDVVRAASHDLPRTEHRFTTALYVGPALLWGFRVGGPVFVEVGTGLGVRLLGESFVVQGYGPVAQHERLSGRATLSVGIPLVDR